MKKKWEQQQNMNENKQIFKNMIWSLLATGLNYVISFLLTPYITRTLGIEAYGFITLSHNFITYIDIIAIALNAFAARYIAIEYHNGRIEKARSYFNSVYAADLVFIGITTIPILFGILNLDKLIIIPPEQVLDVKILFALVYVNYCISILGSLFSSLLFIKNRTDITYRNKGLSTLLYAALLISAVFFTQFKVYSAAIAQVVSALLYAAANYLSSKKNLPEISANLSEYDRKSIRDIISSGIWNSINNLGNMLNNGLDLLVTNRFLTNEIMGQVSVGKQLSGVYNTISAMVVQSFQPKQLEYYSKGQTQKLVDSLNKSIKISGVIGCSIFGIYVILGRQFLELWLGPGNNDYIYYLGLITLAGDIMPFTNRPLYYVFVLTDKLKINCFVTLVTGILNFIFMLVMLNVTDLGGYVIVGSTTLAYALTLWLVSFQSRIYLKLEKNPFNKYIIKNYLAGAVLLGCGWFLRKALPISNWFALILFAGCTGLITVFLLSMFLLNRQERIVLRDTIMTKIRRNKSK